MYVICNVCMYVCMYRYVCISDVTLARVLFISIFPDFVQPETFGGKYVKRTQIQILLLTSTPLIFEHNTPQNLNPFSPLPANDTMNNNVVPPQPTTIETATSEFHAGVTAVLRSYSALKTAVEKEWGGVASKEKAEFLRTHILNCFDYAKKNPSIDVYDLEDNIAIYMEEEFSVVVEDDSEKLIAQAIFSLYENCGNGDFTLSRQFVENVTKAAQEKVKVVVQTEGELDEDSDDDEMDTLDTSTSVNVAQDYAGDFLFGAPAGQAKKVSSGPPPRQLGEPEPEAPQPEVDDDGFAVVSTKKGRR